MTFHILFLFLEFSEDFEWEMDSEEFFIIEDEYSSVGEIFITFVVEIGKKLHLTIEIRIVLLHKITLCLIIFTIIYKL